MKNIIRLLRPEQWLKNVFVFVPVFFDGHITEWSYVAPSLVTFAAFCMAASGVYCFNDTIDAESDRLHPKKCHRPVASGAVTVTAAYVQTALCLLLSTATVLCYGWRAESGTCGAEGYGVTAVLLSILGLYVAMNAVYCLWLKQKPIVDVFIIAVGFVLRIVIGGVATGVELTHWVVLMSFLLALFLAFAKRRDDVVMFESKGTIARRNVVRYNVDFMNQTITVLASITMVCYIMYTVSPEVIERFNSRYVYVTSVFVLAGIIRYLQVTIVDVKSGSPTRVLVHDHFIQACIVGWTLAFCVIIYAS